MLYDPRAGCGNGSYVGGDARIVHAIAGSDYLPKIVFDDGRSGTIDLSTRLFGKMFEPRKNPALFSQVRLDEFGAARWPNGADLAPDALWRSLSAFVAPDNIAAA